MKINKFLFILVSSILFTTTSCCNKRCDNNRNESCCTKNKQIENSISKEEVIAAQKSWGDGIIKIGEAFLKKEDYKEVAKEHIKKHYNYEEGEVLFKPTLAAETQFRLTPEDALSYFVAGDKNHPEDHGFAIKPWNKVRFENAGLILLGETALAMGNYYFTPVNGDKETKVEFSFAYIKDKEGKLKIILHGSHLPYSPKH